MTLWHPVWTNHVEGLDMSYITTQMVVGGEPASTFPKTLYRDQVKVILEYLISKVGDNFTWVNLQLEPSDYDFDLIRNFKEGSFIHFPLEDHQPIPISKLLQIIYKIHEIYQENDSDHLIYIHCKQGKGRSGTVACAYLLFKYQYLSTPNEIYSRFEQIRMARGFHQIYSFSQKRYLEYFYDLLISSERQQLFNLWYGSGVQTKVIQIQFHGLYLPFQQQLEVALDEQNLLQESELIVKRDTLLINLNHVVDRSGDLKLQLKTSCFGVPSSSSSLSINVLFETMNNPKITDCTDAFVKFLKKNQKTQIVIPDETNTEQTDTSLKFSPISPIEIQVPQCKFDGIKGTNQKGLKFFEYIRLVVQLESSDTRLLTKSMQAVQAFNSKLLHHLAKSERQFSLLGN
ncbi:BA75_02248T0 [Komagataella pastoris]|uniref:phosphatidylinositol-3,4,5-trisphosphate 3-phosphatase n=1 Tax=Komagataella pastoris TaxID=4922 RepID=A0A1B2JCX9_PICPA|nr:BA75_02248T0 [Komagataella pastoris]